MTANTDPLDAEIQAYEAQRVALESQHMGEWVVFFGGRCVGAYKSFDAAADAAEEQFGRQPHLIRKVGAAQARLPSALWPQAHVT